jgi:hypothetical protein
MALSEDADAMYLYDVDSEFFEGAHIFPLQYHELVRCSNMARGGLVVVSLSSHSPQWDRQGFSNIVKDPYSVPGASKSSTSRLNTDARRMNAIDNGLLLCVRHHLQFDAHLFSIHPEVGISPIFLGTRLNCRDARHMS